MVAGQTAFTESGRPFKPSQTRKNTSATPRLRSSVSTAIQNFAAAVAEPHPEDVFVASEIDPDRGIHRRRTIASMKMAA